MADQMNDVSILSMNPQNITDSNEGSVYVFSEINVDNRPGLYKTSFINLRDRIKKDTMEEVSIGNVTVDLDNLLGTVTMPDV